MTPKARKFSKLNEKYSVISGGTFPADAEPGNVQGGIYTLEDGTTMKMSVADLQSLPTLPVWKGIENVS